MPGRHGGRLKARFLRRLSVMSGSVNNVAACNPPPPPDYNERQYRYFQNRNRKPVLQNEPGFGNPSLVDCHEVGRHDSGKTLGPRGRLSSAVVLSIRSRVRFILSVCPSLCGGKAVALCDLINTRKQTQFIKQLRLEVLA